MLRHKTAETKSCSFSLAWRDNPGSSEAACKACLKRSLLLWSFQAVALAVWWWFCWTKERLSQKLIALHKRVQYHIASQVCHPGSCVGSCGIPSEIWVRIGWSPSWSRDWPGAFRWTSVRAQRWNLAQGLQSLLGFVAHEPAKQLLSFLYLFQDPHIPNLPWSWCISAQ